MKKTPLRICPSVLAADFACLADEVRRSEAAGADCLHIDIMDGHFVKNLSMGPAIVSAINRSTNLPLHVHLMMYNPFDYVDRFVEAGADILSFHFEATEDIEETLLFIRRCNIQAGLALNPETPASFLPRFLPLLDAIVVMSVQPGFGGQGFLPETVEKLQEIRQYVDSEKREPSQGPISIAVDGGVTLETARLCAKAGATTLVSGTSLFSAPDMAKAIAAMRNAGG